MVKISVVTVCFNAQDTIRQTIESVIGQEDCRMEYLIQDGASRDETVSIVKEYQAVYPIKLVSESDNGLYDAMNRAVARAAGEYVIFLNSGDVFCNRKVLNRIESRLDGDIVIGNVIRLNEKSRVRESYGGKNTIFRLLLSGRMPCHQVMFSKRALLSELPFDLTYSICADFDFVVKCTKRKCSMRYVDVDVSEVDCVSGISSQRENLWEMRRQDDRSLRENFPVWYYVIKLPKGIVRGFKRRAERKGPAGKA
ncbi:MAG: glycosyltransferase [Roseburia sp.]|nr:glycosyltransferase [Roseburia sp.]